MREALVIMNRSTIFIRWEWTHRSCPFLQSSLCVEYCTGRNPGFLLQISNSDARHCCLALFYHLFYELRYRLYQATSPFLMQRHPHQSVVSFPVMEQGQPYAWRPGVWLPPDD